jgi:hypothetical protein
MKTPRVTQVSGLALLLAGLCNVGGCAAGMGEDNDALDQTADESVGEVAEALSVCGTKPKTGPCQMATCQNKHWQVKDRANGTPCTDSCGSGTCNSGECSSRVEGTAQPSYYVLAVVYSPPGNDSGAASSVSYGTGSSAGTTVGTSSSFKSGVTVTADVGAEGGVSVNGGFSFTKASASSVTVTKTQDLVIAGQGGIHDGIDHDRDTIWLWLNPSIDVSLCGDHADWQFGSENDEPMETQYVYVRWLKRPQEMPVGVKHVLTANGITPALYPQILARDPFANGAAAIDPGRFVKTTTSFPYEPPFEAGDAPFSTELTISNLTASSSSTTKTYEYTVGCSWSGGVPLIAKLTTSLQLTWTNSTSKTSSTSSSEKASVKITGPSFGYTGPTNMAVYYDTLYKTFMFVPIDYPAALSGMATNTAGQLLINEPISLQLNGVTYNTLSGRDGAYQFFDLPSGTAAVNVRGTQRSLPVTHPSLLHIDPTLFTLP